MSDKTAIWDALGVTDPAQTKGFSRAGGFRGTAVKPMWVMQRLTEQFGPCGVGWGVSEPSFRLVEAGDDILVYCTVSAWHTAPENVLWGVGGDKVAGKNKNGTFTDDEAFKKAFTDAIMNAFKFIGVAADVHMGRFDDNKYVQEARETFNPSKPTKQEDTHGPDWPNLINPATISSHAAKKDEALTNSFRDVRGLLAFASTREAFDKLVKDVTPTVATFPETWRRVLWGEYEATRVELEENAQA